jgi:FkbM family methyltransferase
MVAFADKDIFTLKFMSFFTTDELEQNKKYDKFKNDYNNGHQKYLFTNLRTNSPINNLFTKMGLNTIENKKYFENKDIIDAGAYIGDTSFVLSEYTGKTGKVHAFEPDPNNYKELIANIKLNTDNHKIKDEVIIPVKKGLSCKEGTLILYSDPTRPSISSLVPEANFHTNDLTEKHEVEITTIDKYAEEKNLKVGLIKSDVEGAEQDLLKEAEKTIKKHKPVLLISIYHNAKDFFEIKPKLEELGYKKFHVQKTDSNSVIADTMLICEP